MNLRIPKGHKAEMHDIPVAGTFGVYLEKTLIATFNKQSQAKTMAKYLNSALARLGPSSSVEQNDMPAALSTWISNASGSVGAGLGFYPPLTIAS